ncbi:MAG: PPOX class F420-dependent oxidoreductase [Pseudomonadota bacterium]
MKKMDTAEWKAFIQSGSRTGKVSTIRADGSPHCVPVWFIFRDEKITFMTWHNSYKAKHIAKDNRISIAVDSEIFPYHFVTIEGTAEIEEPSMEDLYNVSKQIAQRYVPEDRVEEYAKRNAVQGEVLVHVIPTKVLSAKDVAS